MLIESILGAVFTIWFGSQEYRMRNMKLELEKKIDKTEVIDLIDLKQEVMKAGQADLKEDTLEIKSKLDRIEQYLLNKK